MFTRALLGAILTVLAISVSAQTPQTISYQGRLTQSGTPVADGSYNVTFRLYAAASGGTALWSETQNVTASNGLFAVRLGAVTPLTLAFDQPYWLGISISGGAELTPRSALAASPYALMARTVAVPLALSGGNAAPLLTVDNTGGGTGVSGHSAGGFGVHALSENNAGLIAASLTNHGAVARTSHSGHAGLIAENFGNSNNAYLAGIRAGVYGFSDDSVGVHGESPAGIAVYGKSIGSNGIMGESQSGEAVFGRSYDGTGVQGESVHGSGLAGQSDDQPGVYGYSDTGPGVSGYSADSTGVVGESYYKVGVTGKSTQGYGVRGEHDGATPAAAVYGANIGSGPGLLGSAALNDNYSAGVVGHHETGSRPGVFGSTGAFPPIPNSDAGVYGYVLSGFRGVMGRSDRSDGCGVYGLADGVYASGIGGQSANGSGVVGGSTNGIGVYGMSVNGDGLRGEASGASKSGIFALNTNPSGYAGYFTGRVHVNGTLSKAAGSFKIDHPLDPGNKYLQHSFVESPDMKNVYDGVVTLDANGEATVTLPVYFEALNKDFRYQLTAIGGPGPNLFIAQKVAGNEFRIAGGTAGMEVSWQVTGIRKDAYAEAHRLQVEIDKTGAERGKYLSPVEHHVSSTLGIDHERTERLQALEKSHQEN